jgi:anti-sigma regulatory factor (Ser/Thr protein kinase)
MYHEVEIDSVAILINDPSQVGEARRAATNCAQAEGLDEEDAGKLALIVAEAATNLIKHAGGGEILIQKIADPECAI